MEPSFYSALRPSLQALVDRVERETGIEIRVQSHSQGRGGQVVETTEETVSLLTSFDLIAIETHGDLESIPEVSYAHELLHAERMFIDGVPHLYPKKTVDGPTASALDNWMEHFVIYPRQLTLCPEAQVDFDRDLAAFWSHRRWGREGYERRFNVLTRYVVTRSSASEPVKRQMRLAVGPQNKTLREASEKIGRLIGDKAELARFVLDFVGVPKEMFWLRWYDVPGKQARWVDL